MNPPPCLSEAAVAVWRYYLPLLTLTPADEAAFAIFCENYANWQQLIAAARNAGPPVVRVAGKPIENPHLTKVAATATSYLAPWNSPVCRTRRIPRWTPKSGHTWTSENRP